MCGMCGVSHSTLRKGMCPRCYMRKLRADNPEYRQRQYECTLRYQKAHPEKVRSWVRNYDRTTMVSIDRFRLNQFFKHMLTAREAIYAGE